MGSNPGPPKPGDQVDVVIEKWVYGGKALGRTGSRVCFVQGALPGETVSAVVTRVHRDYLEADIRSVLRPDPERRVAPCVFYGRCGGCHLQHASDDLQDRLKVGALLETFRRVGGLDLARVGLSPLLSSPGRLAYRNRVRLRSRREGGSLVFGLYAEGSHDLVPVDRCLLVPDALNAIIATAGDILSNAVPAEETPMVELQMSVPGERVIIVLETRRLLSDDVVALLLDRFRARHAGVAGLVARSRDGRRTAGETALDYEAAGMIFRVSDRSFVQPNWPLSALLADRIVEWSGVCAEGNRNVLELFSGVGTFSLPLARRGFFVTGLERNGFSVGDARFNVGSNAAARCRFVQWDVDRGIPEKILAGPPPDIALLDPPRTGVPDAALSGLARLGPRRILYLSCDPPTLARDLGRLASRGYALRRIQPVDFFPQTFHLETLVELIRDQNRPARNDRTRAIKQKG